MITQQRQLLCIVPNMDNETNPRAIAIDRRNSFDIYKYNTYDDRIIHEPGLWHVDQHDAFMFTRRRPTQEDGWKILADLWSKTPPPKKRLIPCEPPHEFIDDIMRIVRVCSMKGYDITAEDAERSWTIYSGKGCAGWLHLPVDDETLFSCVLGVCRVLSGPEGTK